MTWRAAHYFARAAVVAGAELSTCSHCETLRVVDGGVTYFIRRAACSCVRRCEPGSCARVLAVAPSCLSPAPFFRAPGSDVRPLTSRAGFRRRARAWLRRRPVVVAPAVAPAPAPQLALW